MNESYLWVIIGVIVGACTIRAMDYLFPPKGPPII